MSTAPWNAQLPENYSRIAEPYADALLDELDQKPFDRDLLRRFADTVGPGPVWELGCGPGHISACLCGLGVQAVGTDIAPGMIRVARQRFPDGEYRLADMRDLPTPPGSLAGIVAFYSLIHLQRSEVVSVLQGLRDALRPAGHLVLAVHRGEGVLTPEAWFDVPVRLDVTRFEAEEMKGFADQAGFVFRELTIRAPVGHEYPHERVYLWVQAPG